LRKERQLAYSNIIGVLGGPLPASKPLIGAKSIGLRMLAAFLSFEFKERSEELRDAEEKKSRFTLGSCEKLPCLERSGKKGKSACTSSRLLRQ